MVPSSHKPVASIRDVLLSFDIQLNPYGRKLIKRWDRSEDDFYVFGIRALGAWSQLVHVLAMPVRIPMEVLESGESRETLPAYLELQHHAYFEATLHLGDSLAAGLAGHPRAAGALLRPFIETALVEVYVNGDMSGRRLDRYLRYLAGKGHRPRFKQMLDEVFAEDRFSAVGTLRDRIEAVFGGTSTGLHARTPGEGLVDWRAGNRAQATYPETVFWFAELAVSVHRMLSLMVLRYPLVLFPVDIVRRFAYSGPMNLFADDITTAYVVDGLRDDHGRVLRRYLEDDEEVRSVLDFYTSQAELTDSDIAADWEEWAQARPGRAALPETPIEARWTMLKAEIASTTWALDRLCAIRLIDESGLSDLDPNAALRSEVLADELAALYGTDSGKRDSGPMPTAPDRDCRDKARDH
jgi:hypothetical protein